ncbi:hypothetical protein ABZP36_034531 [Zizania latifolia]
MGAEMGVVPACLTRSPAFIGRGTMPAEWHGGLHCRSAAVHAVVEHARVILARLDAAMPVTGWNHTSVRIDGSTLQCSDPCVIPAPAGSVRTTLASGKRVSGFRPRYAAACGTYGAMELANSDTMDGDGDGDQVVRVYSECPFRMDRNLWPTCLPFSHSARVQLAASSAQHATAAFNFFPASSEQHGTVDACMHA